MKRSVIAALIALGISFSTTPSAQALEGPLSGKTIVIDPGHQLGNGAPEFADEINSTKFNGAIVKGCNTTGTATNAGFPEATLNWKIAKQLRQLLEGQGATVVLTRDSNSRSKWGPCVWDRAGIANAAKADAMVSIHADGGPSNGRGFFVIEPVRIKGWTDDVIEVDRRFAADMIAGMKAAGAPPSTYIAGQRMVSREQSTLNFSDVPTVIVEVGNMRNKQDAALMMSTAGQRNYATWLLAGVDRFFR